MARRLTSYDLMELYIIGIVEGAVSNRAGSIFLVFFMALLALFILILSHTFLSKAFNKTSWNLYLKAFS
jgi:hypothetical protein